MTVVQLWTAQKFPLAQQEARGYRVSQCSVYECVIHAATVSIGGSQWNPGQWKNSSAHSCDKKKEKKQNPDSNWCPFFAFHSAHVTLLSWHALTVLLATVHSFTREEWAGDSRHWDSRWEECSCYDNTAEPSKLPKLVENVASGQRRPQNQRKSNNQFCRKTQQRVKDRGQGQKRRNQTREHRWNNMNMVRE